MSLEIVSIARVRRVDGRLVAEGPPHTNEPVRGNTADHDTDPSTCYRQALLNQDLMGREVVVLGKRGSKAACCGPFSRRHDVQWIEQWQCREGVCWLCPGS